MSIAKESEAKKTILPKNTDSNLYGWDQNLGNMTSGSTFLT